MFNKKEKKKSNKESHKLVKAESKKTSRQEKKRAKKIKTTLDWMDIQEITSEGILLQRGNTERIVKGIQLEPVNIYLEVVQDRMRRIRSLANAYDKLKFTLYMQFVRTIPDMDRYIDYYQNMAKNESNTSIRSLMQIQLNKLDWFSDNFREVIFYVMIQEDEETIDKKYHSLKSEFKQAGFTVYDMSVSDYETIVKNEFDNDTVNEYLYTQILIPKDEYLEREMI